ncbi:LysR substrate-binding domain-containing protein [Sneathiella marina]|uniref:LysR substrate-binding domain-containing protein n=1 Tax=Sneathiella marina TaxID=2950108 RepID=A0ABY4W3F1_9PROT|nr:LysR substrate-binding domain-containing protein [Sneathiella marina]USG61578.1 LysR substrate-binding domain-containing protein [Sneathiella marina]
MLHSQLRSFHAVAKEGGFTAASKAINVGQPTISSQIKALEDHYGVTLFHRRGRKVLLSDCGHALFRVSNRILMLEEEAQNLLVNYGGLLTGALRVGAVGPYHATEMLGSFNEKFPGIKLSVTQGNSMNMVELLQDYTVDVAVLAHTEDNPALFSRPFSRHEVVIFVNASHPFAGRSSIRLKELQGQRFLHRETGSTTRLAIEKALCRQNIDVDEVMELGSREAVWLAVERGIGIGAVSDIEFNPHPNLRALKISDADIFTTAHVTCLEERRDSRIIRAFFDIAWSMKAAP